MKEKNSVSPPQAGALSPEIMKEKLLALAKPIDEFMREHGIASFSFDNGGAHKVHLEGIWVYLRD